MTDQVYVLDWRRVADELAAALRRTHGSLAFDGARALAAYDRAATESDQARAAITADDTLHQRRTR